MCRRLGGQPRLVSGPPGELPGQVRTASTDRPHRRRDDVLDGLPIGEAVGNAGYPVMTGADSDGNSVVEGTHRQPARGSSFEPTTCTPLS